MFSKGSVLRRRPVLGRFLSSALTGVGSLLIARVVVGMATLGLFAFLARTLTPDELGLFGLAWSVSYLFAAITEGGYGMLVVREVARAPALAGRYLGAFLPIRLAVAVAILVGAAGLSVSLGWDSPAVVFLMAATAANLQVVSGVPRDFLIGTDRAKWAALHAIVETILRTVAIIVAAVVTHSVVVIFAVAALFHAAWILVSMPVVWRLLRPVGIIAGARSWRAFLRESLPFGAFTILGAVFAQMDVVVVSALLPLAAVATLQLAIRILATTDYVPEAAWRWAYPRLSRSANRSTPAFTQQMTRLAIVLMGLGVFAGVLLLLIAPWLIPFVFGSQYTTAVLPMQLMAAAIPLRFGAHVYGTALSAAGLQWLRARLFFLVIVLAIVAEAILIVSVGMIGAAIGIIASSAVLLLVYFGAARRAWGPGVDARPIAAVVAIVATSAIVVAQQLRG